MGTLIEKISQLGFSEEAGLLFFAKEEKWQDLSPRIKHVINTIKPFAFYCINGNPFILFLKRPKNDEAKKLIHRQIWNTQTPIVIIEDIDCVKIFNGFAFNQNKSLLLELADAADIDKFSFWNIISGNTWYSLENEFKRKRLDEYLLENIQYVTERLCSTMNRSLATLLVLRLIFVRYMIDRDIDLNFKYISSDKKQARLDFNNLVADNDMLYALFAHLKNSFNGNLFELYVDKITGLSEKNLISADNLRDLQLFIGGNNLKTNQLAMFDLYDFNIIPVELISNIYERFLGSDQRKKDGAFYTPTFLVDYILKFTLEPHLKLNKTCTVLDPACGSGIFLVETLRKIIERNLGDRQFIESDDELTSYLTNNIFGVDKNEEAINVAIFSLYITLLDYKNPKQLKGFNFPLLRGYNFIPADFFNHIVDEKLKSITFDFIIGNPPWGSQPGSTNDVLNYHVNFITKVNKENKCNLISDHQIAQSFLIRAKEFASQETQCGLIVTSKLLYNSSAHPFRNKFLLEKCSVNKILELSPVRFNLFKNAQAPTAIILYSYNKPAENQKIIHQSLKPNVFLQYFQIIVSEKYDTKNVPQSLLKEYDWLWKVLVYGNVLDFYFIKNYCHNSNKYISFKRFMEHFGIISGAGFKIGKKDRKANINSIENLPLVKGVNFQSLYIDKENLRSFSCEYPALNHINGTGKLKVYKAPHLLIKRGAKNIPVIAYSDFDCCFPNTVFGLVSTNDNVDSLKSIGAILSSNISSYFTFCLSTQWGIERDEVLLQDYKAIPFPLLDSNELNYLAKQFSSKMIERENYFSEVLHSYQEEIPNFDNDVLKLYEIDSQEESLIDYNKTVSIPLFKKQSSPYRKLKKDDFTPYINVFIEHFADIFNEEGKYMEIIIHPEVSNSYFAALEFNIVKDKPKSIIVLSNKHDYTIDYWAKFSVEKHTQYFYEQKDVINFETDSFYIIKPNEYKNWHPAVAYLDLEEIVDSFLKYNG